MEQALTTTLGQRVVKIKFYLNQTVQNVIAIGKELTEAKNEVPHGQWQNWLQENFNLSQSTAQRFMKCWERFGKSATLQDLNYGQMIQLFALPEGEVDNFIAEKAAEGTPVENMTVKTLREEIQQYKRDIDAYANENNRLQSICRENVSRADKAEAKLYKAEISLQNLFVDFEQAKKQNDALKSENATLKNQKPITVEPADYQQLKKARVQLQNKIDALQKQLDKKTVEVVTPADYEETKKELARLKAAQSEIVLRMDIFQKLDTIADFINAVIISPSKSGIQDYMREFPDKFGGMCADMIDFTNSYYKG